MKTLVRLRYNLNIEDLGLPAQTTFWATNLKIVYQTDWIKFEASDLRLSYSRRYIKSLEAEVYDK